MRLKTDHIHEAAKAHTDLNIFYAIIAILEGGTISIESDRAAQRIITQCKTAAGSALTRYDKHKEMTQPQEKR